MLELSGISCKRPERLEYAGICWNRLEKVVIGWNRLEYVGIG